MPNVVNSVNILFVRHVKQEAETGMFRAVQPLVQMLDMLLCDTKILKNQIDFSISPPLYSKEFK